MTFYDPTVQNLVALLNDEFSGTSADASLSDRFRTMSHEQWTELFRLAACQGVLAIAYDALKRNGLESLPPREVRLRWALSAENIRERYERQRKAASELAEVFARHGIRMLVFKGLALSRHYPVPQSRECGDIDIYLFGDYERANSLIESMGIEVDYENDRHSVFIFDGVMVENHATLTDCRNHCERVIENALQHYADNAIISDNSYYLPSPEFGLLFVLRHSARHFATTGITFRHLIDWALLLKNEINTVDIKSMTNIVIDSGLAKFWDISTLTSEIITGISLPYLISTTELSVQPDIKLNADFPNRKATRTEKKILRFIDQLIKVGQIKGSRSPGNFAVLMRKVRLTLNGLPRYSFVPDGYVKMRLLPAIRKAVRNPSRLF